MIFFLDFGASPAATSGGIFGQKPVSASPFSGQTGFEHSLVSICYQKTHKDLKY